MKCRPSGRKAPPAGVTSPAARDVTCTGCPPAAGTEAALEAMQCRGDLPVLFISGKPVEAWELRNQIYLPLFHGRKDGFSGKAVSSRGSAGEGVRSAAIREIVSPSGDSILCHVAAPEALKRWVDPVSLHLLLEEEKGAPGHPMLWPNMAAKLLSGRAGERMSQVKIYKSDPEKRFRRVLSASTLAGDKVRNAAGEDLGKIDELMIDVPSGKVAYAVLSFGGVLGMGSKLFAIPWRALTLDEDEKRFVLNVDKGTLESAPGFDKDNWPDMADPNFGSQIYSHYGVTPYWE